MKNQAPRKQRNPLRLSFTFIAIAVIAATRTISAATPGTKLWEFATDGEIYSSPAIAPDGTIYFGSRDHKLYALTPAGKKKWEFQTADRIDAPPAIGRDGTIYVGSYDNTFYAVTADGQKRWQVISGSTITEGAAVASDGTAYFVSEDGNLYAIAENGTKKWQLKMGGSVAAPSLDRDGTIYLGRPDGYLYAINPDSTTKWKFRIRDTTFTGRLGFSCVLDEEGTIYFLTQFAQLFALDPDGTKKLGLSSGASFDSIAPVIGPGNTLYGVDIEVFLRALSPNGDKKWQYNLPGIASTSNGSVATTGLAVAADGTIYIGVLEGGNSTFALMALDRQGARWKFETPAAIYSSPVIGTNGTVYFGCNDNKLYAVAGLSGPGGAPWPMDRGNAQHTGALSAPVFDQLSLGVNMYAGLIINGKVGHSFRVEYVSKLTDPWSPVATVTLDRAPFLFIDTSTTNSNRRFYRAIQLPQ